MSYIDLSKVIHNDLVYNIIYDSFHQLFNNEDDL
jgi:hypothetical protein